MELRGLYRPSRAESALSKRPSRKSHSRPMPSSGSKNRMLAPWDRGRETTVPNAPSQTRKPPERQPGTPLASPPSRRGRVPTQHRTERTTPPRVLEVQNAHNRRKGVRVKPQCGVEQAACGLINPVGHGRARARIGKSTRSHAMHGRAHAAAKPSEGHAARSNHTPKVKAAS